MIYLYLSYELELQNNVLDWIKKYLTHFYDDGEQVIFSITLIFQRFR